mmetsp:Transcript_18263/g.25978  ORF Transcript_18263/g.25978 Transcript_18263/m.25978 type:complete len:195 (+) Transcript_18263:601-1185(+)
MFSSTVASPARITAVAGSSNEASRRSNFGVARAAPENEEEVTFVCSSNKRTENRVKSTVASSDPPLYDMSTSPVRQIRAPRGSFDPVLQRNNAYSNSFISYQDQLVRAIGSLLDTKLDMQFTRFLQDVNMNIHEIMQSYVHAEIGNVIHIHSAAEESASISIVSRTVGNETAVADNDQNSHAGGSSNAVNDENK